MTSAEPKPDGETERRAITARAGVVAAGTLTSRALGLGRDSVMAAIFTRLETDAFFIAFTIPNVLRQLLAEGAVQNAVLPVLAQVKEKEGDQAAQRFFAAARGLSLAILFVVTLLGVLGAPWLVELFASGFHQHPGQFERTVELTRWVFPYILFIGSAALGVAALNIYRRFVVTAFAPALLNVAFIACALLLPGWLGARGTERILAMAAGALIGGALQVVAQWPSLRRIGFLERPRLEFTPAVREALRRMAPVLVGVGVYYVDVVLARRFLSELDVGAQSYFAYAMRLCDVPQGIFVMALQAATLPSLALLVTRGDITEVGKTYSHGVRLSLFVALSCSALVIALAEPLVSLLFERGAFTAEDAHQTALALVAQGAGIWMIAIVRQLVAVYYAFGDTRTPVIVSALDLCVFVTLALTLRGPLGHVGVSLAVTGASAAQMVMLWVGLRRHLSDLRLAEIAGSAARTLAATLPAVTAAWWSAAVMARLLGDDAFSRMVPGLTGAVVFPLVFLPMAFLLRSKELASIVDAVRRRRAG